MTQVSVEWFNVKFKDMEEEFNFSDMGLVRRSMSITYCNLKDQEPVLKPSTPGVWEIVQGDNVIGKVTHMKYGSSILTEPTHF